MQGLDIRANLPAVADDGACDGLVDAVFAQNFTGFDAMLLRIHFVVQIMQQADNAPKFNILSCNRAKWRMTPSTAKAWRSNAVSLI